ncbi:MAG: cupin domain-containing protein [Parcubacteria group bacterium]|nr:cupin domain-containing protein [Parcubacteria group bacterium]
MDIKQYKEQAELIRDNETYKVYDLSTLKDLNLSLTELNPGKETGGHSHKEADEVYVFIGGQGRIELEKEIIPVKEGDVIAIPGGKFHKVFNEGKNILSFWSIFEKYEGRGK